MNGDVEEFQYSWDSIGLPKWSDVVGAHGIPEPSRPITQRGKTQGQRRLAVVETLGLANRPFRFFVDYAGRRLLAPRSLLVNKLGRYANHAAYTGWFEHTLPGFSITSFTTADRKRYGKLDHIAYDPFFTPRKAKGLSAGSEPEPLLRRGPWSRWPLGGLVHEQTGECSCSRSIIPEARYHDAQPIVKSPPAFRVDVGVSTIERPKALVIARNGLRGAAKGTLASFMDALLASLAALFRCGG